MPLALDKQASVVLAPPLQAQLDTLGVNSAPKAEVQGISMPQLQAEEPLLSHDLIFIVNSKVIVAPLIPFDLSKGISGSTITRVVPTGSEDGRTP